VTLSTLAFAVLASHVAVPQASAQITAPARQQDSAFPAAQPGQMETVATLAVQSYNGIINDIGFLGSLADRPEAGQMIEGFIALFTQGRGLAGLDKTKPWGVLVRTDGVEFMPIACLPVSNVRELAELLVAFGVQVQDLGDDVLEIQVPEKPSTFVKSQGNWAYLSSDVDYLDNLPVDPDTQFNQLLTDYDGALHVAAQKVPESYRQMAIEQMKAGLEEGLEREEGESDEEYQMRRNWSESQMKSLVRLIEEIEDLNFGWNLDAQQQRIYIDSWYHVAPGGKLDQALTSAAQNARTDFAGFYQPDQAVCFTMVQKTDPELMREELANAKMTMVTLRKQIAKGIDEEDDDLPQDPAARQAIKDAVNEFLDAVEATIETGHIEAGGVLSVQPSAVTLIAGGYVADTAKVEAGMQKLAEMPREDPDAPQVQWNADEHAGVRFHTLQAPIKEDDEEARKLFGSTVDMTLGIGNDAVYFGLGRDNLPALQGAIDASRAQPQKPVPIAEWLISVGQILNFSASFMDEEEDEQQRLITQAIADMLHNEAQGRDHVRVVGQPIEHGLRYRVEAEEGVLKALGKAIDVAQQAAATGGF
jgi:hypothetical protein